MSSAPWLRWAFVLGLVAMPPAVSAQSVDAPCKNHYILSIDGNPADNSKCQAAIPPPPGEIPSLRIAQVYSSMDGSMQYVELTEYAGRNDQNHIAGLTLTINAAGVTKTLVFPYDLPSAHTANASYVVAVSPAMDLATGLPMLYQNTGCCEGFREAEFSMPERFLAVQGGTLSFAGLDTWTYPALPTDGSHALYRDGTTKLAIVFGELHCPQQQYGLCASGIAVSAPLVHAVEYRDVFNDARFVTAEAAAIGLIDAGGSPGWVRTGREFDVGGGAVTYLSVEYTYIGSPVCRVRIPMDNGVSYFYSLAQDECEVAAHEPGAVVETTAAFYAQSPDWKAGTCAPLPGFIDGDIDTRPVYRVSSPQSAFDTRLTTDVAERDALLAVGWKKSGFGPDGTALCVY
jgi:hypothetical protein